MVHYREALRLNPSYAEAHYNLGYTLLQAGRKDEAVTHLRESLRLKPDYAEPRQQLRALGLEISE